MTYEMLPTLQETLKTCSHERVAEVLVAQYVASGGRRRERVRSYYAEMLERMCSAPADEPSGIVIVPRVRFSCSPSFVITRSIEATCVDVKNHGVCLGGIGVKPWEQVLSYGVWAGNDMCLHDRYALVADACWHMANAGETPREARMKTTLHAGEILRSQRGGTWCFGRMGEVADLVDEEYREVMRDLVEGWNADADIAFYAEALAMRRYVHAA